MRQPSVARGFALKLNALFSWAVAEMQGFVLDACRRLRARTAWGMERQHRYNGKRGPSLERPAIKWLLNVLIAFLTGLVRWS